MSAALAKIEQDIKDAMKARESVRVGVLRMLVNRIKMVAKNDGNRESTDEDVITGIQKAIKEANETRDIYVSKGVSTEEQDTEIAILSGYLPKQMTSEELESIIAAMIRDQALGSMGRSAMGPIMASLKSRFSGQYDPKMASTIAATLVA